ncbi:protein SLOW GREEN 1, chloroplastic [Gastrolobium bilobum]|uniref:protein SLOW GREEN 1, chloroplastic n=1 Tax=Gastrolobium bilobum TaxID=150636 RepID=UPI002AAF6197|nr:protein SLOW GREEN 1, chloroplastic [Gastrolobium bilobum]
MTSTLATASSTIFSFNSNSTNPPSSPNLHFLPQLRRQHNPRITVRAHSSNSNDPILQNLKTFAGAALFAAAVSAVKFPASPARAEPPATVLEENDIDRGKTTSPLSEFLETKDEAVEALKSLLQQKLELGEDEEALKILKRLVSAQPEVTDWKFLTARLMNEIGDVESARNLYEEILTANPLSFEALFENALVMDRCGEGEAVIKRLEEALRVAEEDKKEKEARDVRLIMAQIQFLQKNVDEALGIYQQLTKEDPKDFRPYFCRGMIYSLLDKNDEAKEQFAKYRELSPKKFEVDGYLRSPLSRMKLFGSDES